MPEIYSDEKISDFYERIGSFLRDARRDSGLTLEDVVSAIDLKVSSSSLSNIEQGRQRISAYQLFRLSQHFGFSVDSMFKEVSGDIEVELDSEVKKIIRDL